MDISRARASKNDVPMQMRPTDSCVGLSSEKSRSTFRSVGSGFEDANSRSVLAPHESETVWQSGKSDLGSIDKGAEFWGWR